MGKRAIIFSQSKKTIHISPENIIIHYTPYILHLPLFFSLQPRKRHALFQHPGHPRIRTKALPPHRASPNDPDPDSGTSRQRSLNLKNVDLSWDINGISMGVLNGCSQWDINGI